MENRRRNNTNEGKTEYVYKKKKKINIIMLLVFITIIVLGCVYGSRGLEIYNRNEAAKKAQEIKKITYPLEVKIETDQIVEIDSILQNYFTGIKSDVNPADGFTNKEMIEFGLNILSDKYSSSGIVPNSAMDLTLNKYFGVTKMDYKKEGYKSLSTKDELKSSENKSIYVFAKMKQLQKDSSDYEMEVHEILITTAKKDIYTENEILSKKIITMKKIEIESMENTPSSRYVFVKSNIE